MGDFEKSLSDDIIRNAVPSGEELVLKFVDANRAIGVATEHLIAVLGVESFRIVQNGLGVMAYSGYSFEPEDWKQFVHLNNREAVRFLAENELGDGYGYILTTTSELEFYRLRRSF
jgi:hypothetical protein